MRELRSSAASVACFVRIVCTLLTIPKALFAATQESRSALRLLVSSRTSEWRGAAIASFLLALVASPALAESGDLRGLTILKLHGSYGYAAHHQQGPGEGLAVGYGLARNIGLLAEYSHQRFTGHGNVRESGLSAAMLTVLVGAPSRSGVAPWLSFGFGNDHLTERGLYWSFFRPNLFEGSFVANHPGIALGGGITTPVSARASIEIGAVYHQSFCGCQVLDASTITEASVLSIETGLVSTILGPAAQAKGEERLAVARIRGGALYWDPSGHGPGWAAGGSVGFGLARNLLLSFNFDHMVPDDPENSPQRSMDPLTFQLEFGTPFQRPITPTMQVGTGVYVRRHTELVFSGSGASHFISGPRESHLGLNVGSGVTISFTRRVALDLLVRYHQAGLGVEPYFRMTTVSAGLTYALPSTRHRRT